MTQADRVLSTPPTNTPIDTTRRRFLSQAAVVAAGGAALGVALPLPVSAGASERVPDPILAAIDRHRRAYEAWMAGMGEDEIGAAVPSERRKSNIVGALHGDPDWQVAGDDPRWIAHIENGVRTGREIDDASIALVSNESLSLAGALALLDYVASIEAKDGGSWPLDLVDDAGERQTWHYFLVTNLSDCLRELMPVSA